MERVSTGISGLDELVEGGFPKGRCVLLCGGPGTGKTIFSIQFLFNGAKYYDEPGVFLTLDENLDHVKENMLRFGWDLEALEEQRKLAMIDLSPVIYLSPEEFKKSMYEVKVKLPEFSIQNVATVIKNQVEELKAARIVIDSITALTVQEPNITKARRNIAHLLKALLETGCTSLITSEVRVTSLEREFQFEEYLTQGVILLQSTVRGDEIIRAIQIEKMRGTAPDMQRHPYYITEKGIKIFSKEKIL